MQKHTVPNTNSVDISGDLSRTSDGFLQQPKGDDFDKEGPLPGPYDKDNAADKKYPLATPVILKTKDGDRWVYRVGIVTRKDFEKGLRITGGPTDPVRLNADIARKCFGESSVYSDRDLAEREAHKMTRDTSVGIKVLEMHLTWHH